MKYDYLIVGSGLYGAVFAHEAKAKGKIIFYIYQDKDTLKTNLLILYNQYLASIHYQEIAYSSIVLELLQNLLLDIGGLFLL